ncbi:MAG: DNA cytosine methyltransferase [Desulfocapsaceae bacterium]|nr:DNA cytosine methyltransferase [Desulfocapsaceae bacterium]
MITFFSGFAGIGGFDESIRRVLPTAKCVGISEVDKHAIQIYEQHFPNVVNYGDITKIKAKELPDFDLFCGGFPCQDLSKSGKHAGLRGARSGLFFDSIRIIRKKRPRLVFYENVKGLLSSLKGWDFARVLVELANLGYCCEWECINSKKFGVPQNRERVFIVGHLGGFPGSKVFPLRENDQIFDEQKIEERFQQNAHCLRGRDYSNWNGNFISRCLTGGGKSGGLHSDMTLVRVGVIGKDLQSTRVYSDDGILKCFSGSGGGMGAKTGLYCISHHPRCGDPAKGGNGILESEKLCYAVDSQPYLISDCGLHRDPQVRTDTVPPLRANTGATHNNVVNGIRRLTPLECERLQGFEDQWTAGVADVHRYRLLGNAVTVPVVAAIMEKIAKIYRWD